MLFGQADDNLVQNEDLSVEKASFIQVDILLDLDGFVSRQTLASELQVKLSFVKHCMHITQLNSITFELGEDLNGQLNPLVDLHKLVCFPVELCASPNKACSDKLAGCYCWLPIFFSEVSVD